MRVSEKDIAMLQEFHEVHFTRFNFENLIKPNIRMFVANYKIKNTININRSKTLIALYCFSFWKKIHVIKKPNEALIKSNLRQYKEVAI